MGQVHSATTEHKIIWIKYILLQLNTKLYVSKLYMI